VHEINLKMDEAVGVGGEEDELMPVLREFKEGVGRVVNLEKMILFGSRAKGAGEESSDVDLLLVSGDFEGVKSFKRSPRFYLMWDAPVDVDIICLTPGELRDKSGHPGIIREAVAGGVAV